MGIALNHLDVTRIPQGARKIVGDPSIGFSVNYAGIANYMLRRYPAAEQNFQQAVSLGPKRYQAWGNLARAQSKTPRTRKRRAQFFNEESDR